MSSDRQTRAEPITSPTTAKAPPTTAEARQHWRRTETFAQWRHIAITTMPPTLCHGVVTKR
ncbi:hypothetical protein [Lysobacter gummosus]|uniref:hypothetical protein n=1 Tax=Lysobacter gummosus TaxID=262324 RepID=UPI003630679C